ncbi:hypothetical protein EDB80DRAFT_876109 [Ilyonectria destructans]|nr:hypothetical protein EDB80DRAFT_876109 [Ilyonectria destructans]
MWTPLVFLTLCLSAFGSMTSSKAKKPIGFAHRLRQPTELAVRNVGDGVHTGFAAALCDVEVEECLEVRSPDDDDDGSSHIETADSGDSITTRAGDSTATDLDDITTTDSVDSTTTNSGDTAVTDTTAMFHILPATIVTGTTIESEIVTRDTLSGHDAPGSSTLLGPTFITLEILTTIISSKTILFGYPKSAPSTKAADKTAKSSPDDVSDTSTETERPESTDDVKLSKSLVSVPVTEAGTVTESAVETSQGFQASSGPDSENKDCRARTLGLNAIAALFMIATWMLWLQ